MLTLTPAKPALDAEFCQAIRAGAAAGVIRMTRERTDCSGIGHLQMVFEVVHMAKGEGLHTLYKQAPTLDSTSTRGQVGDVFVAVIEPRKQSERRVSCVEIPATDGVVGIRADVDSVEAGKRWLQAALDPARACDALDAGP